MSEADNAWTTADSKPAKKPKVESVTVWYDNQRCKWFKEVNYTPKSMYDGKYWVLKGKGGEKSLLKRLGRQILNHYAATHFWAPDPVGLLKITGVPIKVCTLTAIIYQDGGVVWTCVPLRLATDEAPVEGTKISVTSDDDQNLHVSCNVWETHVHSGMCSIRRYLERLSTCLQTTVFSDLIQQLPFMARGMTIKGGSKKEEES